MKVWVVMYSDRSGVSRIFESKGQATLYNRWSENGEAVIEEFDVELVGHTLMEINA